VKREDEREEESRKKKKEKRKEGRKANGFHSFPILFPAGQNIFQDFKTYLPLMSNL
jgi:hypothetical protein